MGSSWRDGGRWRLTKNHLRKSFKLCRSRLSLTLGRGAGEPDDSQAYELSSPDVSEGVLVGIRRVGGGDAAAAFCFGACSYGKNAAMFSLVRFSRSTIIAFVTSGCPAASGGFDAVGDFFLRDSGRVAAVFSVFARFLNLRIERSNLALIIGSSHWRARI